MLRGQDGADMPRVPGDRRNSLSDDTKRSSRRRENSGRSRCQMAAEGLTRAAYLRFHPSTTQEEIMEIRCVVAIVRSDVLTMLEKRLGALHIHGITVSKVKGFGEHPN